MKTSSNQWLAFLAVAALSLGASAAFARGKSTVKRELTGVANLNTATAQQLDQLPGVGEKAARRILEFRAKTPFAKVDDLRKVKGFGAKKLEKLRPYLTVTGPTTLAVKKLKAGEGEAPTAQGRAGPPAAKR